MNVNRAYAAERPSLEDVKSRTSLVALVGRDVALKKRGWDYWGCCPFHAEKTASFKVSEDRQAFYCHGCGAHGDCFDYVRLAHGMTFAEALEYLAVEAGLMPDSEGGKRPIRKPVARQNTTTDDADERRRQEYARKIWHDARPIKDTPAETYLCKRKLKPGPDGWSGYLRYHPGTKHGPTGLYLPALIAVVTIWPSREVSGVHRTFLRADGMGKAPVSNNKMMLGPCAGGAVRLAPRGPELVLSEGLETAMSVQQETGLPVWACLSTSGLCSVILPPEVETVIIAADNDLNGAGEKAAQKVAKRFLAEGRAAKIARPPRGMDFNDVLQLPAGVAVIQDHKRRARHDR